MAIAELAPEAPGSVELRRAKRLRKRATAERRWATVSLWIGVAIVVIVPLFSVIGPLIGFGHPNLQNFSDVLQPPSLAHPFGTDQLGRDVLSRVFAATPLDYEVGVLTTLAAGLIGVVLGGVAGYFGGALDAFVMRVVDVLLAFPFMIFVMAFVVVFGPGLTGIYVGLITFGWAFFARVTRAEMLVIRERQYIAAARTLGLGTWRILTVHALPNVLRPNFVVAMATIVWNILTLAALSYLGLGVQPPTPEWGSIVASGQTIMFSAWWISTLPGLVIVLVGVGFSLIGDGVGDRFGYDFRMTV
ncbi:MAG: ABC transporter permease [Acidimicrobiales bacterium]